MAATIKCDTLQNTSSATANVTLDGSGNATVGNNLTVTGQTIPSSSFKRNRIINGNMQIWQRSTAPAAANLTSWTYNSVDRYVFLSGASTSLTVSQNTSVPTGLFQYSTKLQRTAANTGTSPLYIYQIIESVNCYDLAGQTVTFSFYAKRGTDFSAASSAIGIGVQTGTVADQGSATIGSWTGFAAPISNVTAITTTWTRYSFTGTIGAGVLEVGVYVTFTPTGTAGADDSIYVTGMQLEVGSAATPYERQIYSDQLAQCQRYFATFGGSSAYEFFAVGLANSNNTGYFSLVLPTTMRSTPSLGYSAFSDICIGYTAGGATATNNVYIGQNSKQIIYVVATVATTPLTGGWALTLQANNTTNARLTFSAEL